MSDICFAVGSQSVGSFTSSFTRTFGMPPTDYRAAHPPAADLARVPACVMRVYSRPKAARFERTPAASVDSMARESSDTQ